MNGRKMMMSKKKTRTNSSKSVSPKSKATKRSSDIRFQIPKVATIVTIVAFLGCFWLVSKQISLAFYVTKHSDIEEKYNLSHVEFSFPQYQSQSQQRQGAETTYHHLGQDINEHKHDNVNTTTITKALTDDFNVTNIATHHIESAINTTAKREHRQPRQPGQKKNIDLQHHSNLPQLTFWIRDTDKANKRIEDLPITVTQFDEYLLLHEKINAKTRLCNDHDDDDDDYHDTSGTSISVTGTGEKDHPMLKCQFLESLNNRTFSSPVNDAVDITAEGSIPSALSATKKNLTEEEKDILYNTYYNEQLYTFYVDWTNSGRKPQKQRKSNKYPSIVSVTYWSVYRQQYIALVPEKTRVSWSDCMGINCPIDCGDEKHIVTAQSDANNAKTVDDNPIDQLIPKYLPKWDPIDYLCKPTHPITLIPNRSFGGACSCRATCYTPESTFVNSSWPWKSQQEYEKFHPPKERIGLRSTEKRKAKRMRRGQKTAYRFVCNNNTKTSNGYATTTSFSSSSFKLPMEAYGDFQHHLFFIPEAKLILCGIPKVGCTEWIKFHRYVFGARDYLSIPHSKGDRDGFMMQSLNRTKAQEMLSDPTWTKAVFFRDPAERLISAYRDKILKEKYTQSVFGMEEGKVLSFQEFVNLVTEENHQPEYDGPRGLHSRTDPHWKSQVMTCGLDYILPQFDFIGSFNHISAHTKELLKRVNFWDEYGSKFDDGSRTKPQGFRCWVKPLPTFDPDQHDNDEINDGKNINDNNNDTTIIRRRIVPSGFNQQSDGGGSKSGRHVHATGARQRMEEYYNTTELLEKVRKAYALDYAIWDEINAKDNGNDNDKTGISNRILSGRDLQVVKDYCGAHPSSV